MSLTKIGFKITYLKSQPNLPGGNELTEWQGTNTAVLTWPPGQHIPLELIETNLISYVNIMKYWMKIINNSFIKNCLNNKQDSLAYDTW